MDVCLIYLRVSKAGLKILQHGKTVNIDFRLNFDQPYLHIPFVQLLHRRSVIESAVCFTASRRWSFVGEV
jgi:hypothetical protein